MKTDIEFWEICQERIGHTNSRRLPDEAGEGRWVYWLCEESMSTAAQCPCGCGDRPENCVYAGAIA